MMKLVAVRARTASLALTNWTNAPAGRGSRLIPREMVRFLTASLARLLTKVPVVLTWGPLKSVQKYRTYWPDPKPGEKGALPVMRPVIGSTLTEALSCLESARSVRSCLRGHQQVVSRCARTRPLQNERLRHLSIWSHWGKAELEEAGVLGSSHVDTYPAV